MSGGRTKAKLPRWGGGGANESRFSTRFRSYGGTGSARARKHEGGSRMKRRRGR